MGTGPHSEFNVKSWLTTSKIHEICVCCNVCEETIVAIEENLLRSEHKRQYAYYFYNTILCSDKNSSNTTDIVVYYGQIRYINFIPKRSVEHTPTVQEVPLHFMMISQTYISDPKIWEAFYKNMAEKNLTRINPSKIEEV